METVANKNKKLMLGSVTSENKNAFIVFNTKLSCYMHKVILLLASNRATTFNHSINKIITYRMSQVIL
jgi:hypothetical protein